MRFLERHLFLIAASVLAVFGILGILIWGPSAVRPANPWLSLLPASAVMSEEHEPAGPVFVPPMNVTEPLDRYIEVIESCGPYWDGTCVNLRSGPGLEYPVVAKLRSGVVLKVAETVVHGGLVWHKIEIDGEIRYPERISSEWYVSADYVRVFEDIGERAFEVGMSISNTKRILVDRSEQMLYAYEGDTLFMQEPISTGLEFTPTPRGTFIIYKKTPSRYMQGPVPDVSDDYYDLPGVPWDLYFTNEGAVIHGAYWHDKFGQPWSHGCVNMEPQKAKQLYLWADLGTPVTVRE